MKVLILLAALAVAAATAGFVATPSAKAAGDPVPGWLVPSCERPAPSDDNFEGKTGYSADCYYDTIATDICGDGTTYTVWNDNVGEVGSMVGAINTSGFGHSARMGACSGGSAAPPPRSPNRAGYCAGPGNTNPDGTPIPQGAFLDLLLGQPDTDPRYAGAVPAFYVQDEGITCLLTPAQVVLAAASTLRAGGDGEIIPYGFYLYVPKG